MSGKEKTTPPQSEGSKKVVVEKEQPNTEHPYYDEYNYQKAMRNMKTKVAQLIATGEEDPGISYAIPTLEEFEKKLTRAETDKKDIPGAKGDEKPKDIGGGSKG